MRPISNWSIVAAALVVLLVSGALAWVLVDIATAPAAPAVPGAPAPPNPATVIDAIRTALTAAAGTGGAAALLLAFRRQRHSEHAALVTRYAATEAADDARQRRVNELYTSAVDQLGHERATVRLGGLYALERLAQNAPEQRQTIVNVLCSYLRMPSGPAPDAAAASAGGTGAERARSEREEREVRLTAQRLLTDHLRAGEDGRSYWGEADRDLDLDLTGAELLDLDLSRCRLGSLRCDDAKFAGSTRFDEISLSGDALFVDAVFEGDVHVNAVTVGGTAAFDGARFAGQADIAQGTVFVGHARFAGTEFAGDARFIETTFRAGASFDRAAFAGFAGFARATFTGPATFVGAEVADEASFSGATFDGPARFARIDDGVRSGDAAFAQGAGLAGASAAASESHRWPPGWALAGAPDKAGRRAVERTPSAGGG